MRLSLVRIGNSHGIRLPQALIKQCEFQKEVEVTVKNKIMTIQSADNMRGKWAQYVYVENEADPIPSTGEWEW